MPRPMYFASFAKKVFLRAGRIDGTVTSQGRRCARRVCGAQLVFCQRPHHGLLSKAAPRLLSKAAPRSWPRCGAAGRRWDGVGERGRTPGTSEEKRGHVSKTT